MTVEGTAKILVVDDEPDAVEFVKTIMEESGHTVITASNGIECIEKARTEMPDLILLDVQMPEKDGFTTFAEMQKDAQLQDIPVVMLTGVAEQTGVRFSASDMGEYLGKEPSAYVEKPVDPVLLAQTVDKLLA